MKLSIVILTKNEEKNINNAIESASFANEILVIDDNSTDDTTAIAVKAGAKVIRRKLNNNFSSQRNYGIQEAKGDWVLFLDADEIISRELRKEIDKAINNNKNSVYYIKRRDIFWGRGLKYGELWNSYRKGFIRLVKKDSGLWKHPIHETYDYKGSFGRLDGFIDHYSHEGIKDFIEKVNIYSSIRAKELNNNGNTTNIFKVFIYPIGKFKANYLFKLGFLDGIPGFIYAFMMSLHSFLVRAKLYQYTKLSSK